MGNRLTKITTRTGDDGNTGLANGLRVPKDGLRMEAMGDVDELNSAVGLVLSYDLRDPIKECLCRVQHRLFDLGGELAMPDQRAITAEVIAGVEADLERFNADLPPLREFILPGGGPAASACHLARAICRRAERHMVALGRQEPINPLAAVLLNRLSDLLFVTARILARDSGGLEVYWRNGRRDGLAAD